MDLVTLGETLVCLTGQETGRIETVRTFRKSIGGAESNTAIGLARLGLASSWISAVSNDGFGEEILKLLRGEGVDVDGVARRPEPTGLMVKERRAPGDVRVHYYRQGSAASCLEPDDIVAERITAARRLHVTGVTLALGAAPRQAVERAVEIAAAAGMSISFDPNLRLKLWSVDEAIDACRAVFPYVTDLLCNEQEAMLLARTDTLDAAVETLMGHGFPTIVIKRGELGAIGYRDGDVVHQQAWPVQAVDSVGAGDAFNAGYLYGQLTDLSFKRSIEVGNWAASHVVAHLGDYEGFPTAADYRIWVDQDVEVTR
ncbi:sugar kinase [Egicoccus sp. AB-alg6-2]|uniref:sugar kinase n=1 Tax=Egicoccus sp. AB-alg6-2 TaxID=3242692 RepID=UPI00359D9520